MSTVVEKWDQKASAPIASTLAGECGLRADTLYGARPLRAAKFLAFAFTIATNSSLNRQL
jgi:hypothetical protein